MSDLDCLIGYTGFVGGTLAGQNTFPARFNSTNIGEIAGQSFGTLICAAAPGSMFQANKAPETDLQNIQTLMDHLSGARAERFVLISSIAVLADAAGGADENTDAYETTLAYGKHRRALETFCEETFEDCLIVRLPALFGSGLRKNFLFDLLNPVPSMLTEAKHNALLDALDGSLRDMAADLYAQNPDIGMFILNRSRLNADPKRAELEEALWTPRLSAVEFHSHETTYQFYDMKRLWDDIQVAANAGLTCIHLVPAPLAAAQVHAALTERTMPETGARLHREDMRTCHAGLWNSEGPYLEDADTVLDKLTRFFAAEKGRL